MYKWNNAYLFFICLIVAVSIVGAFFILDGGDGGPNYTRTDGRSGRREEYWDRIPVSSSCVQWWSKVSLFLDGLKSPCLACLKIQSDFGFYTLTYDDGPVESHVLTGLVPSKACW